MGRLTFYEPIKICVNPKKGLTYNDA